MKSRQLIIVFLLGCEACAPKLSTDLSDARHWAQAQPPCRRIIPGEWAPSFPVPSEDFSGRKFKIFFYPIEGNPTTGPILYEAAGEAVVDADTHAPISCELWPLEPKRVYGERWPPASDALPYDGFRKSIAKMLDRAEKIALVYATKRPATPKDKALAKEYLSLFELHAEPLYLANYYRMNPKFWEWIRAIAGDSIPKA